MARSVSERNSLWKTIVNLLHNVKDEDILKSTRFARMLLRFEGFSLYDLRKLPNNRAQTSVSRVGLCSWLLWSTATLWCTYNLVFCKPLISDTKLSFVERHGSFIDNSVTFIVAGYFYMSAATGNSANCQFFEKLFAIDNLLRKLDARINYGSISCSLFCMACFHVGATIVLASLVYVLMETQQVENFGHIIFIEIIRCNLTAIGSMKIYGYMKVLQSRHRILNEVLTDVLYAARHEVAVLGRPKSSSRKLTAPHKITAVSEIFSEIHDLKSFVNDTLGTSACLLTFYSFFSITLFSYYMIETAARGISPDLYRTYCHYVAHCVVTAVYRSMAIYWIGDACGKVYDESAVTVTITHDIIYEQIDDETNNTASLLSLQLLHQQYTFTANGLFDLDRSLVKSMLGAVFGYLIILVQFANDKTLDHIAQWGHTTPAA